MSCHISVSEQQKLSSSSAQTSFCRREEVDELSQLTITKIVKPQSGDKGVFILSGRTERSAFPMKMVISQPESIRINF